MDASLKAQIQHYVWWFRNQYGGYPQLLRTPDDDAIDIEPREAEDPDNQIIDALGELPGETWERLVGDKNIRIIPRPKDAQLMSGVQVYKLTDIPGVRTSYIGTDDKENDKKDEDSEDEDSEDEDSEDKDSEDGDEDSEDDGIVIYYKGKTLKLLNDDEDNGSKLTEWLQVNHPDFYAQFKDGDGLITGDLDRNDGYFIYHEGQFLDLVTEDGFHDYGLPPLVVRPYYALTWMDYGFLQ